MAGFDATRLTAAVDHARRLAHSSLPVSEATWAAQLEAVHIQSGEPQPAVVGPLVLPLGPNGVILRSGYIVAEWGNTTAPETVASVTKSFLSIIAGLAVADGSIADVDGAVGAEVLDGGYNLAQNRMITWRHHLEQTSEWQGALFGMDDRNDRRGELRDAPYQQPGTRWGYNDVRVNRLALSLLRVLGRPLPEVLEQRVMRPIGATTTWRWHGYRTSAVELAGRQVESVSGGAHWGGGMVISARDLARVGLLHLRGGRWGDRQLLDPEWIRRSTVPVALRPDYGFLWWLNAQRGLSRLGSPRAYAMMGGGGYYCWIDPDHDLVVVIKGLSGNVPQLREVLDAIYEAMTD